MWDDEAQNIWDFMEYTKNGANGEHCSICFKCKIEGTKLPKKEKIRRWWHVFVPILWSAYTLIDEDPYCDSYVCSSCGNKWRTPKKGR